MTGYFDPNNMAARIHQVLEVEKKIDEIREDISAPININWLLDDANVLEGGKLTPFGQKVFDAIWPSIAGEFSFRIDQARRDTVKQSLNIVAEAVRKMHNYYDSDSRKCEEVNAIVAAIEEGIRGRH